MNKKLDLGINIKPWWKELDKLRIAHYAEMIETNQRSSLMLLPGYSHGIHNQEPKLVANAIVETYMNCLKAGKN